MVEESNRSQETRDAIAESMIARGAEGVETQRIRNRRAIVNKKYLPDDYLNGIDTSLKGILTEIKTGLSSFKDKDEWRDNKSMFEPLNHLINLGLNHPDISDENKTALTTIENEINSNLIPLHNEIHWNNRDDNAVLETFNRVQNHTAKLNIPENIVKTPPKVDEKKDSEVVIAKDESPKATTLSKTPPKTSAEEKNKAPEASTAAEDKEVKAEAKEPAVKEEEPNSTSMPMAEPALEPPNPMHDLADRLYENPNLSNMGETLAEYLHEMGRGKLSHEERQQVEQRLLDRANEDHTKLESQIKGESVAPPTRSGSFANVGNNVLTRHANHQYSQRVPGWMGKRLRNGEIEYASDGNNVALAKLNKFHSNWEKSVGIELNQADAEYDALARNNKTQDASLYQSDLDKANTLPNAPTLPIG